MARKNKRARRNGLSSQSVASSSSSGKRHKNRRNTLKLALIGFALFSIAVVGSFVLYVNSQVARTDNAHSSAEAPRFLAGSVYGCRRIPAFVHQNGLRQPVAVDTKQSKILGPVFRELRPNGKVFRDASWEEVGHTGTVILDKRGDMFIFPVPAVSLDHNPPHKQNRVYRIDGKTAEMSLFIELPGHDAPNHSNPFGVMGLAYDCETDSLYISSIAGSKPNQELGAIYQVDIKSTKIVSQIAGLDVLGMGVFNTIKEKRLYFGSARDTGIYSFVLASSGAIPSSVKPRYEFALSDIPDGSTSKAKKIRFTRAKDRGHLVTISELDFDYRLIAQHTNLVKKYIFRYKPNKDIWVYKHFEWE